MMNGSDTEWSGWKPYTVSRWGMSYEKHWLWVSRIHTKRTREEKKRIQNVHERMQNRKRYKLLLMCCDTYELREMEKQRESDAKKKKKKWQIHRSHGRSYEGAWLVWNRVCDDKCFCMMTCATDVWAPADTSDGTPQLSTHIVTNAVGRNNVQPIYSGRCYQ